MNAGAEQMPHSVSEGQPERPADDNSQYAAAGCVGRSPVVTGPPGPEVR